MRISPMMEKRESAKLPELIRDVLMTSAARYGEKTAFMQKEDGEYKNYSFRRYRSDVEALGTELLCRGLSGKNIVVSGENCYAWVVSYMAVVSGVGVVVPVDCDLSADNMAEVIKRADAAAILCSESVAHKLEETGLLENGLDMMTFFELPTWIERGHAALNSGVQELFHTDIEPDEMAAIYFTSGTQGVSRGVMLSNANITHALGQTASLVAVGSQDVFLSVLPLHHIYECVVGFLGAMWLGATVAFGEGLGRIIKNMSEVKPTVMICVPMLLETLYRKIKAEITGSGKEKRIKNTIKLTNAIRPTRLAMAAKRKAFEDIHRMLGGNLRLIVSGGFPADPRILDRLNSLGFCAVQGYGLTETAALVAVNPMWESVSASVGVCLPEGTLDIYNVQEDGTGEIRYKGRNIMLGYYKDPELTAEVKRGEWLYTGDLGYLDDDGYLYVTGRKKNVIIKAGGKSVFPEELEACLARDRFVREVVVVGFINDAERDYDLVAVIHPNYEVFREEFGEHFTRRNVEKELNRVLVETNASLPAHKQIRTFVIRETAFEKNASRKIKRGGIAPSIVEMYRRKMEGEKGKDQ